MGQGISLNGIETVPPKFIIATVQLPDRLRLDFSNLDQPTLAPQAFGHAKRNWMRKHGTDHLSAEPPFRYRMSFLSVSPLRLCDGVFAAANENQSGRYPVPCHPISA